MTNWADILDEFQRGKTLKEQVNPWNHGKRPEDNVPGFF
jgi:hypothetical protein